jgi:hypothetical protein
MEKIPYMPSKLHSFLYDIENIIFKYVTTGEKICYLRM